MDNTEKIRADILVFKKGLARSRQNAQELIKEGKVFVGGEKIEKANELLLEDSDIIVTEQSKYVSRAGLKLEEALKKFEIDVTGKIALDVGSSTGGFTDCLLQNNAKKVYAVDVGTDQLVQKIKNDSRVVSLEKTDIRDLSELPEKIDLAVIDVSFISLELVLPSVLKFIKSKGEIVALFKPQFEVGRENLGKGGIVKDENAKKKSLEKIKDFVKKIGLKIIDEITSPIKGGDGNEEYLLYFLVGNTGFEPVTSRM